MSIFRTTGLVLAAVLFAGHAAGDTDVHFPTRLEADGFQQVLADTGRVYVSGQPDESGLRRMAQAGVRTVINLRTPREMDDREIVPFDERAAVEKLGMRYVHIPLGGDEYPYDAAALAAFDTALAQSDGNVLLHCTVAWRASHMWTAWLVRHRGLPLDEAVRHGRAINFGTLPLEGLLERPLALQFAPQTHAPQE